MTVVASQAKNIPFSQVFNIKEKKTFKYTNKPTSIQHVVIKYLVIHMWVEL